MTTSTRREAPLQRQPECVLIVPVYDCSDEPNWAASLGYMNYSTGMLTPMGERWMFDTLDQALDASHFLAQRVDGGRVKV